MPAHATSGPHTHTHTVTKINGNWRNGKWVCEDLKVMCWTVGRMSAWHHSFLEDESKWEVLLSSRVHVHHYPHLPLQSSLRLFKNTSPNQLLSSSTVFLSSLYLMLQTLFCSQAEKQLQTVKQTRSEFFPMEQMGNGWLNLAAASQPTTAGVALTSIRDGL